MDTIKVHRRANTARRDKDATLFFGMMVDRIHDLFPREGSRFRSLDVPSIHHPSQTFSYTGNSQKALPTYTMRFFQAGNNRRYT